MRYFIKRKFFKRMSKFVKLMKKTNIKRTNELLDDFIKANRERIKDLLLYNGLSQLSDDIDVVLTEDENSKMVKFAKKMFLFSSLMLVYTI